MKKILLLGMLAVFLFSCKNDNKVEHVERAFYYWKSDGSFGSDTRKGLESVNADKLYVKYFEVDYSETMGNFPYDKTNIDRYSVDNFIDLKSFRRYSSKMKSSNSIRIKISTNLPIILFFSSINTTQRNFKKLQLLMKSRLIATGQNRQKINISTCSEKSGNCLKKKSAARCACIRINIPKSWVFRRLIKQR